MSKDLGLTKAIGNRDAAIVVGAGVSISISGGAAAASWSGLLNSGVDFLSAHDSNFTSGHREHIVSGLKLALDENDTDLLISTASDIQIRIKKLGEVAFSNWLDDSVGALAVRHDAWGKAILSLGCPVLTTNYDTLLEQVSGSSTTTWADGRAMHKTVIGDGNIGHIHGSWDAPDTIILSSADYERHQASPQIQELQKALLTLRSLVFVGYGSGMTDPNFSNFLSWSRKTFPESATSHYILCRDSELDDLRVEYANDNLTPVAYGAEYSDLPKFLASIQPESGSIPAIVGVRQDAIVEGKERFLDDVRERALLLELAGGGTGSSLDELIHPPVLLAVPHTEFLRTKRDADGDAGRLNPKDEAGERGVLVIVGDENAGLTTTLKWLVWTATCDTMDTAPVYLDFPIFPSGVGPLKSRLQKEALSQGLIARKSDPLPPIAVAIDNFSPYATKAQRVIDDFVANGAEFLVLGCRSGDENAVAELLQERKIEHRVRYIGRLTVNDIRAMADLIAPERSEQVATSVMNLLASEHLPRTPITVAMLISIICQGGQVALNTSPTAIIDHFVDLLLGRGESGDDTRLGVGAANRESILADLAGLFVERREASLPESTAVTRMEKLFERFAWPESPTEVLRELVGRRLLRVNEQRVSFTQSTYLHLFAAKHAVKKSDAKALLVGDPMYFAPVLKAYAALAQWDEAPLKTVELVLDSFVGMELSGLAFAPLAQQEVPENLFQDSPDSADEKQGQSSSERNPTPHSGHPFDNLADGDIVPFSSVEESDLPAAVRLLRSVDLASTILRDGEEVEDLELKTRVLFKTLTGWGKLIDALGDDPNFVEFITAQVEAAAPGLADDSDPLDEIEALLLRVFPALVVAGGITSTLSSRKLSLILQRLFESEDVNSSEHAAFSAAILTIDLAGDGWINQVSSLVQDHGQRIVFSEFIGMLLQIAYEKSTVGSSEQALLGVVVELRALGFRYSSDAEKKSVKAGMRQQLAKSKSNRLQLNKNDAN